MIRFLGWEYPLQEGLTIHSSLLGWRIPGIEEPGGATVHRVAKSWTQLKQPSTHTCILTTLFPSGEEHRVTCREDGRETVSPYLSMNFES